ncbi:MAG TPA: hypothetical protein V6C71_19620 [Coleofasciculaceae cyanobacterium]|jgi:hypothetical protein
MNNYELVFLLEEPSMKETLENLLPKIIPYQILNPKQEFKKIATDYQKISGSRAISQHLNLENNKSPSFNVFIQGVRKILLKASTSRNEKKLREWR